MDFEPVNGEEIVAFMDEVLSHSPVNIGKYNVDVQEFLDEYYVNELITAEECADKIQGRGGNLAQRVIKSFLCK